MRAKDAVAEPQRGAGEWRQAKRRADGEGNRMQGPTSAPGSCTSRIQDAFLSEQVHQTGKLFVAEKKDGEQMRKNGS